MENDQEIQYHDTPLYHCGYGKYLITMQDNPSTEITVSRNNVKTLKKVLAL